MSLIHQRLEGLRGNPVGELVPCLNVFMPSEAKSNNRFTPVQSDLSTGSCSSFIREPQRNHNRYMLKCRYYSPKKDAYHIFYPETSNRTILQKKKSVLETFNVSILHFN